MPGSADGLRQRLERRYTLLADETKNELVHRLRDKAPALTGRTKAGVKGEVHRGSVGHFTIVVEDEEPPALFTDKGTRPHVIVPRQAKVLAWKVGGVTVFAAKVNHTGNRGTGWFSNTVESAGVQAAIRAALLRIPD